MCSIWISIGFYPPAGALDAARHRGPDSKGLLKFESNSGPMLLSHRRLSIYDLTPAGAQPMQSVNGRFSIVFNGAIYNFKELRSSLEAQGEKFETRSDTEVLLRLWMTEGQYGLSRLNGMFAFAVHDAVAQTVTIVRDRFGEKPLHYALWKQGGRSCFAAASEVGQLLQANRQLAIMNQGVAGNFVNFGATDWTNDTFFEGISRLPAGHLAELNLARLPDSRAGISIKRWWTPPEIDLGLSTPEIASEALRPALERSVDIRMEADVPVGFCLSGGLDSSAILGLAARHPQSTRQTCITAMFDEMTASGVNLSERLYIDAIAEAIDIDRVSVTPADKEIAMAFDAVAHCQGEPFASTSVIAQWLVFQAARSSGRKVMLDGQGADELLAGYPGMAGHHVADLVMSGRLLSALTEIRQLAKPPSDFTVMGLLRSSYSVALPERSRRAIGRLKGSWPPRPWPASVGLPALVAGNNGRHLDQLIASLVGSVSLPSLLRYEDRNSMAFGIESRLPFLDSDVSDIALRAPGIVKIADGETKRMLRLAVERVVPEIILRRRRKLGFSSPEQRWLAGPLADLARYTVDTLPARTGGFIDGSQLHGILQRSENEPALANMVFRLMSLERWMDAYGTSA